MLFSVADQWFLYIIFFLVFLFLLSCTFICIAYITTIHTYTYFYISSLFHVSFPCRHGWKDHISFIHFTYKFCFYGWMSFHTAAILQNVLDVPTTTERLKLSHSTKGCECRFSSRLHESGSHFPLWD